MGIKHKDFNSLDSLVGYVNGEDYAITAINQGTKQVTVRGDITLRLEVTDSFDISGSTSNDGTYTVAAISTSGGSTVITTNEAIPDPTADGVATPATLPQADIGTIQHRDGRWWLTWWT